MMVSLRVELQFSMVDWLSHIKHWPPDPQVLPIPMNRFELPSEGILHINRKWENNRIESEHAALKKLITPMRGFKSLSSAKATLRGIEAVRTIKHGHVHAKPPGVTGEIRFVEGLFGLAA